MGKNVIIRLISVFALVLLLSSCGGNGEESGGYGSIAFSVDWMDAPTLDLSHGASRAAIDCTASGVATVTATVYDSGNNAIATGGPWACTAHSGAITNVPAGSSRKLVIVGNDSEGKVKYRGELSGITVEDGKSFNAGSVATTNFVPALSAPANGATITNGAFSFTWAGIGSASSYRIQISTSSGFSSTAIDTTVSTNSYAPSSQLSGTYYWRVRAIDAMAHDGAWSVAYSCAVSSAQGTAPTAPTGVTATAGEGQVAISWSTVTGATSYNLYWATTSGVSKTGGTKIAGVTSPYAHTGLTNGTKYYYVATAVNGYGESAISSEVSGTPRVATVSYTYSVDFESGELLSGLTVSTAGSFSSPPAIKKITNFGSSKAFGFGLSTCGASCFDSFTTTLTITLPSPTYVATLSFDEIELYGNWGSGGEVKVDGVNVQGLGREPFNDGIADTSVRSHQCELNRVVNRISFRVGDITRSSEIFIDNITMITDVPLDTTPPTVSSTTPAGNATGVAVNSAISATFSEAVQASSLTTSTFTVGGITGTVSVNGTTATFTPSANLAYSTAYTATITTGVKDAAGNALAANYSWTFTTGVAPDATPPTVSSTTPAGSATGVAVNSAVSATFSEAVQASSLTTSTFTVAGVTGTVSVNGTTATFTPSANLAYSTAYTATVTTGVKDAAGNALAANYSWTFTTGAAPETTPPTVSSTTPANNATGVAVSSAVSATFSEAMNASSITTASFSVVGISGTVALNGTTATFTPTSKLSYGTSFTAIITTGVKDSAGNALASTYSWTFTTEAAPVNYFADDFENGLGKWEVSGQDWAVISNDFRNGSNSITDSPNGNYLDNASSRITMARSIDLSSAISPQLTFWHKYFLRNYVGYIDRAKVDISSDGGMSWNEIASFENTSSAWYKTIVDLSAYKSKPVLIRFRLSSDGKYQSDGWYIDDVVIQEKNVSTQQAFPFSDDFENGLYNWEVSSQDWAVISSDFRSGGHSITDSPNGDYSDNSSARITMARSIDLSSAISPQLTFWHKYFLRNYVGYIDRAKVDISSDGGMSWNEIASFENTSSAWYKTIVDLSAYKSKPVLIRFRLSADGSYVSDGWYIDDVSIFDSAAP